MKKIAVALAFLVLGLYSCKKDSMPTEQANTKPEVTASGDFIKSMKEFNEKFKNNSSKTNDPKPTGWFDAVVKAVYVGAADIVGAGGGIAAGKEIIGAVGLATGGTGAGVVTVICAASGAAVASISAHDAIKSKKNGVLGGTWEGNPLPSYPGQFAAMYEIGVLHNDYITNITYAGIDKNEWIASKYSSIDDRSTAIMALDHSIYKNVLQNQEQPVAAYCNSLDYKTLTKSYKDLGYISPNVETVLNEFLNVYLRITDANDLTRIENFYISKVTDKSNGLSDEERMSILASISVGHHSLEYWYNKN